MAALTDLSDLINRMTGGNNGSPENLFFHKAARVSGATAPNTVSGRACSLWRHEGMPAGGAVPTSGAVPDRTTVGALPFTAPGAGREKWLIGASVVPSIPGLYLLYDRLFHIGGLNATLTTAQTVQGSPASPALTRNTSGAGNFVFYEIYTAIGTTATTLTMTYTAQDGNPNQVSTINIGGTSFREATRAQRIPLAGGDSGVQAVTSVQLTATTGTAGDFGLTIAQPLAWIPVGFGGTAGWRDYTTGLPGIPAINADACLALMHITTASSPTELFGALSFVEK